MTSEKLSLCSYSKAHSEETGLKICSHLNTSSQGQPVLMHHGQDVLDTQEPCRTEVATSVVFCDFAPELITIPPEGI